MNTPVILAIVEMFGMFALGMLARRLGYIREEEIGRWSTFIMDILFPMLILYSITHDLDRQRLIELWPLPLLGFGTILLGLLAGYLLKIPLRNSRPDIIKTFHLLCCLSNYGFLPLIVIMNLWGSEKIALLFLFNLGNTIGYWTIGVGVLDSRGTAWRRCRNLFNPGFTAIMLALILSLSGLSDYLPEVFFKVCHSAGSAAVPCMLILIGASLYGVKLRRELATIAYLSVIRLLLLPVIFIAILKLLPLAEDVRGVAYILALMPVAVSSTLLTQRYGGSTEFAARAAVVTTLCSGITIPMALAWLI
ncbi:MAG: AEC family transporter [Planctomycetes bacterium]|nr:AEC family transporter [Planctomycetota bacterium]